MKNTFKLLVSFILVVIVGVIMALILKPSAQKKSTSTPISTSATTSPSQNVKEIALPIRNALSRVTKKHFGTTVSPQHSPVSPERFTGIHTGADFEVFPNEETTDVPIYAICTGPLLVKESASGYGGVLSQGCSFNGSPYTVIYGHLQLKSITKNKGDTLKVGEQIALLGKGYSSETDGERKHLHLGIHKGSEVNLHGYVGTMQELSQWTDPLSIISTK